MTKEYAVEFLMGPNSGYSESLLVESPLAGQTQEDCLAERLEEKYGVCLESFKVLYDTQGRIAQGVGLGSRDSGERDELFVVSVQLLQG